MVCLLELPSWSTSAARATSGWATKPTAADYGAPGARTRWRAETTGSGSPSGLAGAGEGGEGVEEPEPGVELSAEALVHGDGLGQERQVRRQHQAVAPDHAEGLAQQVGDRDLAEGPGELVVDEDGQVIAQRLPIRRGTGEAELDEPVDERLTVA